MGEENPLERAIAATNSRMASGSKVMDSMATGWTDEMHGLYLDSVEASFVKKLYSSKYGSNDLRGWLPRTHTHTQPSESDSKNQSFDQFKVLRRGCWEKLKVGRAKNQSENDNVSRKLAKDPWIRHFRSHSTAKEPHATLASQLKDSNLAGPSVHLINRNNGIESTSSRQPPASPLPYSHKIHKFSVGGITEFSDQNFVNVEVERGEEFSRRRGKKRVRSAVSLDTDQVVPFAQTYDERTAILKENDEECIKKELEDTGDSMQTEPDSPMNDQQNDPNLDGG